MTTTRAFTDEDSVYAEGLLQSVPLFRNMPHEALIDLSSRLRWIKWPAGRDIFHVDADGATLYIILSGAVKVFIPALDGREVVLAVLRKSDLLGEMSLLDGEPRSASATTVEPTEMASLSSEVFWSVLERHPDAQQAVINVLTKRLRATNQSIQDAYLLQVPGRLARRLLSVADEHGVDSEDGREIGLKLSQQEIANMIGASRVAVNKQLQLWRKEGIVSLKRQQITILDRSALEREYALSP